MLARQQQHIGLRQQPLDVILLAHEPHPGLHAQLMRQPLDGAALGPIAHHPKLSVHVGNHFRQHPHTVGRPLHRTEVRKMHEAGPATMRLLRWVIEFAVDEVVNGAHRRRDAEYLARPVHQIPAYRSDAVRLLDRKFRDLKVTGLEAHQRDIGAVQRRNEWQLPPALGQHLARQVRRDRMGNGVVDMQQIEVILRGDVSHARR